MEGLHAGTKLEMGTVKYSCCNYNPVRTLPQFSPYDSVRFLSHLSFNIRERFPKSKEVLLVCSVCRSPLFVYPSQCSLKEMTCINETDNAGTVTRNGDGCTNLTARLNTSSNTSRGRHKERIRDDGACWLTINVCRFLSSNKLDINNLESNAWRTDV